MRRRLISQNGSAPVEPYLRVTPTEVMWVDTDLPGEYLVLSNAVWIVR